MASGSRPPILLDPANRLEAAKGRRCDAPAEALSRLVAGAPEFHPLLVDAEERRASIAALLDRFAGRFRIATPGEREVLGDVSFVPDLRPLGRAATAADVECGLALFHLEGEGIPMDVVLPARGLVPDGGGAVLVVQSERDAQGRVRHGVLARRSISIVEEERLTDLRPLE